MSRAVLAFRPSCGAQRHPVRDGALVGLGLAQLFALAAILWWLS
jgi:hypothetical protein